MRISVKLLIAATCCSIINSYSLDAKPFKVHEYQKFTIPIKKIYKDKEMHYLVPDNYKEKKLPLIILLHGGGPTSPASHALSYLKWDYTKGGYWGGLFTRSGAVIAAPHSFNGWANKAVGEYLACVIAESVKRYNIDPQRVHLLGWSMGGCGAYYAMLHYSDMFASIVALAGAQRRACDFKNLGRTKAYLIHGRNDAVYKKRPHYSDVQFASVIAGLMKRDKLDYMLLLNDGGHMAFDHKESFWKFWNDAKGRTRDLSSLYMSGKERNRGWITVEKYVPGTISVDYIYTQGKCGRWKSWNFSEKEFNEFKVLCRKKNIEGGRVEAVYHGNNKFDIKTKNIAALTVHMNPQMVDYSKPVEITVDGQKLFSKTVKPNSENAKSYSKERKLPGLLYDGKVTLQLNKQK